MTQQINLFNPVFLKQRKVFSAVSMLDALAVLLVGVAVFYAYASIESLNLDRQSVVTARQYERAQAQLAQTSARYAPKKFDASLEAEVNRLKEQLSARKATLDRLGIGHIANGASYAEYMRALARQSLAGLWLTEIRVGKGGAEVEIVGRVLQPELVPAYIQRLNQEPAMQGRSFDSLSMTQREDILPVDASAPVGAPVKYSYTEFRLGSDYALPSVEGKAAPGLQNAVSAGSLRPAQTRNGEAK